MSGKLRKHIATHVRKQAKRHALNALAMKELFPDILTPFTVQEIVDTWQQYSKDQYCAGWTAVDESDKERVRQVFTVAQSMSPRDDEA